MLTTYGASSHGARCGTSHFPVCHNIPRTSTNLDTNCLNAVTDINALLSEPSMMTLPRTNLIFQAPMTLLIVVAILVSPLIPIFAPSLTVRRADAVTLTLTVPTLDLTTDRVLDDFTEQ